MFRSYNWDGCAFDWNMKHQMVKHRALWTWAIKWVRFDLAMWRKKFHIILFRLYNWGGCTFDSLWILALLDVPRGAAPIKTMTVLYLLSDQVCSVESSMVLICFVDFISILEQVLLIAIIPVKLVSFFEVLLATGHWWCLLGGQSGANNGWWVTGVGQRSLGSVRGAREFLVWVITQNNKIFNQIAKMIGIWCLYRVSPDYRNQKWFLQLRRCWLSTCMAGIVSWHKYRSMQYIWWSLLVYGVLVMVWCWCSLQSDYSGIDDGWWSQWLDNVIFDLFRSVCMHNGLEVPKKLQQLETARKES